MPPVEVVVTVNIDLANPGHLTDPAGRTHSEVMLTAQTAERENGVYRYQGPTTALTRVVPGE
jgi:hypothetical protein